MKIPIIRINQNENLFFIGKIKVEDLVAIATNKIRKTYDKSKLKGYFDEIDDKITHKINQGNIWYLKDLLNDPNIQREQSKKRVKEIGKYLENSSISFPNSIIINLSSAKTGFLANELVKVQSDYIEFDEKDIVATVIDGQHRLAGFNYINNEEKKKKLLSEFDLIVTMFIDLTVGQQAEMFAIVNGKQKPVNKSILYDLTELSEEEYTELMTGHLITKWFNVNEKSPWYGKIKMLGTGEGRLSQAAFIDAILPLFNEISLNRRKNKPLPVLRPYFLQKKEPFIMKILLYYFRAFRKLFEHEWDNPKYILTKTTGINGILKLFPYIFYELYNQNNLENYDAYVEKVSKLENFNFSSKKYKGGGIGIQNQLYEDMFKVLFMNVNVKELESKYLKYYQSVTIAHKI